MDVLKPDILVLEGIRYRLNPGNYESYNRKADEQYSEQYNEMPPLETLSDGEEDVEEAEGGRFRCTFHIPKTYFPYIIGSKGATKKRLETETRSKILIPKQGHDGDIVITAATKKSVASARRRIRLMVMSSRKRQALTHFISIPVNQPSFINGFMNFKNEVLQKFGKDRGIRESIFQIPERLHLTIGVLVLSDESERNEASAVLQDCKDVVIRPLLQDNKLRVIMSGVEYMNDDPSEVDVLYGKVSCYNDEYLLQDIVDGINTYFSKKGLLEKERDRVKLHATLMNTKFGNEDVSDRRKETFDATNIIQHFRDFYFGEDIVSTIELSLMYSSSKTGYYQATSSISIP